MTRTTNDVEAITKACLGAVSLIADALVILGTFAVMLWIDWRLSRRFSHSRRSSLSL